MIGNLMAVGWQHEVAMMSMREPCGGNMLAMAIIAHYYGSATGWGGNNMAMCDGNVMAVTVCRGRCPRTFVGQWARVGRGAGRNPSHPRRLAITLPSRGQHIASILPPHGHRIGMAILEPAHAHHVGITLLSCGNHVAIKLPSRGNRVTRTWPARSHLVAIAWPAQRHQ